MALEIKTLIDIQGIKTNGSIQRQIDTLFNGEKIGKEIDDSIKSLGSKIASVKRELGNLAAPGLDISPQINNIEKAFSALTNSFRGATTGASTYTKAISLIQDEFAKLGSGGGIKNFESNLKNLKKKLSELFENAGNKKGESEFLASEVLSTEGIKAFSKFIDEQKKLAIESANIQEEIGSKERSAQQKLIENDKKFYAAKASEARKSDQEERQRVERRQQFAEQKFAKQADFEKEAAKSRFIKGIESGGTGQVLDVQKREIEAQKARIDADTNFYAQLSANARKSEKDLTDLQKYANELRVNNAKKSGQEALKEAEAASAYQAAQAKRSNDQFRGVLNGRLEAIRQENAAAAQAAAQETTRRSFLDRLRIGSQKEQEKFEKQQSKEQTQRTRFFSRLAGNSQRLEERDNRAAQRDTDRRDRFQNNLRVNSQRLQERAETQAAREAANALRDLQRAYAALDREIAHTQANLQRSGLRHSPELDNLRALRNEIAGAIGPPGGGPPNNPPNNPPNGPLPDPNRINQAIAASRAVRNARDEALRASSAFFQFGEQAGLAFKRYSAFLIGTSVTFAVSRAIGQAKQEFLAFEAQLTKLEQISEGSKEQIQDIGDEFIRLSQKTGLSAAEIGKATQTLAQAGFGKAADLPALRKFADEIAKIPLAATFGSIEETTDGLIAIFGQFNKTLSDTSEILDVVNQFANDFAIESKDIFEIVKRGGSVFATAGGQFKELVELASLVRSSTRLSAETIGTFFKTGFTQLLSPKSQAQLKLFGVTAADTVEQITQLAEIFGSGKFSEIEKIQKASTLVGARQIGPFLALLREVNKEENKQKIAAANTNVLGSLDRSVAKRLDDVGVSLERISRNIEAFFITIDNDENIKKFVQSIADLTSGLKDLIGPLKAVLPLAAGFVALASFRAASQFARGFATKVNLPNFGIGAGAGLAIQAQRNLNNFEPFNPTGPAQAFSNYPLREARLRRVRNGRFRQIAVPTAITGASFGVGLAGQLIGDELQQSASVDTARTGQRISTVAGFASAGAGIGALFGGVGAPVGLAIGAFVGGLKAATDALREFKSQALANSLRIADNDPQKIFKAISNEAFDLSNQATQVDINQFKRLNGRAPTFEEIGSEVKANNRLYEVEKATRKEFDEAFKGLGTKNEKSQALETGLKIAADKAREDALKGLDLSNTKESDFGSVVDKVNEEIKKQLAQQIVDASQGSVDFDTALSKIEGAFTKNFVKGINASDLTSRIKKQFIDTFDQIAAQFKDSADDISRAFRTANDALVATFENIGKTSDQLNSIITDRNASQKALLPTSNKDLFKVAGFSGISNFQKDTEDIAKQLSSAFNDKEIFDRLRNLKEILDNSKKEKDDLKGQTDSITNILSSDKPDDKATRALITQLQKLAVESGKDLIDVIKQFVEDKNKDTLSTVEGLRGQADNVQRVADAIRADFENFNRKQDISNSLRDAIRSLGEAADQAKTHIEDMADALKDRLATQLEFTTKAGGVESARSAASRALGVANRSQFGNQSGFISTLLNSARNFNKAQEGAGAANRGLGGDPKQARIEADNARAVFLDNQAELGRRLAELDKQVGGAARAADLLRQAFNEFDGQIKSAGSAVTQFTTKDLGDSLNALQEYQNKGLEGLSDSQFGSLQKLLSAAGDFNLGNGITGNKILGDINSQLGTAFLSVVRSQFTGETVDQSQQAITAQLEQLRKEQEAAATLEKSLREKQLSLLDAQAQLIPIEQDFYKKQLDTLDAIDTKADALGDIRAILNSSLKLPIPVVVGAKGSSTGTPGQVIPDNLLKNIVPKIRENTNKPDSYPGQTPSYLYPNSPAPKDNIPQQFSPNNYPGGRLPSHMVPNYTPPAEKQQYDPFDPKNYPGGRLPSYLQPTNPDNKNINDVLDPFKNGINSTVDNFDKLTGSLKNYSDTIDKLVQQLGKTGLGGNTSNSLEVAPIQVNVAITAPDILKLAGSQMANMVIAQIAPAIAKSFGILSPEARSSFESNIPQV